jgi:ATPase subunit of ABC transporter with duplicated ATPase domains
MLIQDLQLEYFPCEFKEFQKRKEEADNARDKMIDTFLKRNTNLNPMSPIYKTALKYKAWQEVRRQRQLLLQGKFTFQAPKPLPCPAGIEQKDISLIKIENVRFSYDVAKGLPFIFDNPISYDVKMGTRVGVMGPNGAGKSTFLKLITGKLTATEGSITVNPDFTLGIFN